MSNECLNAVFARSRAQGVARLVILALADRADESGRASFGMDDLRFRTRASRAQLFAAVKRLSNMGEIRVASRSGRYGANVYWLGDALKRVTKDEVYDLKSRFLGLESGLPESENQTNSSENQTAESENRTSKSGKQTETVRKSDHNPSNPLLTPIEPKDVALPDSLKGQEGFGKLWAEFEAMRVEKGRPLTSRGRVILLDVLAERPSDAKDALRLALGREWQEIRWEWYDRARSQEATPRPSSAPYAPAVPHASPPVAPLLPKPHQRVDRTLLDPAAVTAYLDKNYPFLGRSHPRRISSPTPPRIC